jgi:hypothetical protein
MKARSKRREEISAVNMTTLGRINELLGAPTSGGYIDRTTWNDACRHQAGTVRRMFDRIAPKCGTYDLPSDVDVTAQAPAE